jgi:hypothetical protein
MRVWSLAGVCALLVGACLYPEYGVQHDGGTGAVGGGTAGAGGRGGGSAGAVATGGHGGVATGAAGSVGGAGTGGVAGSASGGTGGAPGTGGSSAGSGGATAGTGGAAGRGGTSGAGGIAGSAAGRGGTTGIAGTTGTAGSVAGRGGTTGVAGTTGAGGSVAGRGGSTAGTGGAAGRGGTTGAGGNAGSTVAPDWLQALSVVYKFDQAPDQLGVEAHGNGALHLEEQGTFLPTLDTTIAIEGGSAKMMGTLQYPTYFQTPSGVPLPTVFQTEPSNSWTTGGWFHITATTNQQWLIHDEGPTDFQQGGFFFYVDQQVGKLASNTAFALCRVGVASNADPLLNNLKEVSTQEDSLVGDVGFDPVVPGNWVHLVCRYNAQANELSIFVAGARRAQKVDTTHTVKSGPGPFLLGCNEPGYCAFQGNMDEVFWTTSALSDAAINRIYACGIDGSRCRCNGSAYAACGFASITSCGNLPACGAGSPP